MHISNLNLDQKKAFCRAMAVCGFQELTDSAFSNALDFLGIDEPENFEYKDGLDGELYEEVEDLVVRMMALQLLFEAIYHPDNFWKHVTLNKGYEFAVSMLSDLKSIQSSESFDEFIDLIKDSF
jgi:hypothetical protein